MVTDSLRELVHTYRMRQESLVHADLHVGNLLVAADGRSTMYLIDWEFARVGELEVITIIIERNRDLNAGREVCNRKETGSRDPAGAGYCS